MEKLKKRTRLWLLALWSFFIIILLTCPFQCDGEELFFTYKDKFVHAVLFSVFAYLVLLYFEDYSNKKKYLLSIFLGICFTLFTEYLQLFIPSRHTSEYDFISGALGVIMINVYVYFRKRKKT